MKKTFFILALIAGTISFVACKTSKDKGGSTTTTTPAASTETLISVAQKKYPSITQADLDEGKKIFTVDCVKCHGEKKITSRDEKRWGEIMDWMAPKAKLNDAQKTKVLQYVLSQRALQLGK